MKHQYRCDSCGCYLDPGEGLLCDECREMVRIRIRGIDNIENSISEGIGGQFVMKLQEALCNT